LTFGSHPLACAAGSATLRAYHEDGLIENAACLGPILGQRLEELKRRHPAVGDVRYIGLFSAIELVKSRETKEPLPSSALAKFLRGEGLFTFLPSNLVFVTPPLCISEAQLEEGLVLIDRALDIADQACAG
jgi:taurine--2-oxoglutarate transaminase